MTRLIRSIIVVLTVIAPTPSSGQDVSVEEIRDVQLEAWPVIPGSSTQDETVPAHFEIETDVQPDFGPLPQLTPVRTSRRIGTRREHQEVVTQIYRQTIGNSRHRSSSNRRPEQPDSWQRSLAQFARARTAAPATALNVTFDAPATQIAEKDSSSGSSKTVSIQPKVRLDVRLLAEKIEAFNQSLAGIENLLRAREEWDLAALESTFTQLGSLKRDREVWSLNRNAVPQSRRRWVAEPRSLDASLALFRQRVFETRVAADIDSAPISLLQITELKQRLAAMRSSVVEWMSGD